MSKKYRQILVTQQQVLDMRGAVKTEFLKNHPEFNGYRITDSFLVQKLIDYYLEG